MVRLSEARSDDASQTYRRTKPPRPDQSRPPRPAVRPLPASGATALPCDVALPRGVHEP